MAYFILHSGDDGFSAEMVDEKTLLERLNEDYYGDVEALLTDNFPVNPDPNYWGSRLMIIKGDLVMPKPVTTVQTWEV